MSMQDWASTGMEGVDAAIDKLRLGDNVCLAGFKIICPYLYELDTVAYFAIKHNIHTALSPVSVKRRSFCSICIR